MRRGCYKLEGHDVVRVEDLFEWARWFETADCSVARSRISITRMGETETTHDFRVMTSFLGLDFRFDGNGPPLVFETVIFEGGHDVWQRRCSTWDEASAMHERAREIVSNWFMPGDGGAA